jgi:hypothetical protein
MWKIDPNTNTNLIIHTHTHTHTCTYDMFAKVGWLEEMKEKKKK